LTKQAKDVIGFVWYLLFAGNLYCVAFGWLGNPFAPLWSISIEEQFYLLWPWAMRWFSKRGLVVCALFFILVANTTLFFLGQRHADSDREIWANSFVQFEMFATGILLAIAKKRLAWQNSAVGLLLVLAGPALWFVACITFHVKQPAEAGTAISGVDMIIGYALIAVGCAAVLEGFSMIGPSHMPRWAAYLGKISYGLYVYHVLAIEFTQVCLGRFHGLSWLLATTLAAFLLTVVAAILSYTFLESPFLKLKRRFENVHTKPV
jgi:peptidoglycan/LPS O-acetylase OafA/YrhL